MKLPDPGPFWTETTAREFGPAEEAALLESVAETSARTLLKEISTIDDLALDHNGTLADGSRLTRTAVHDLLGLACPGSAAAIREICVPRAGKDPAEYSTAMALGLFNRLIELRSARLVGKIRLVQDVTARLIDGALGSGYILYENQQLLEHAEPLRQATGATWFYSGHLRGRHLTARYLQPEPAQVVCDGPLAGNWHPGVVVENSEVGDVSVHVAPILVHATTGGVARGRSAVRLMHSGRRFPDKLRRSFATASIVLGRTLGTAIAQLNRRGDPREDGPNPADARDRVKLLRALRARGLTADAAARIVEIAAAEPGADGPAGAAAVLKAVLVVGTTSAWHRREPLERLAYGLLHGEAILGGSR